MSSIFPLKVFFWNSPPSLISVDLEVRCLLYTVFGSVVLISSSITVIVFTFTNDFRTKYALFNGLAIADFINGMSFVLAGIFRSHYMHEGTYFIQVTNSECIWGTPWAVLMLIAGQLPASLNLCLSLERVAALQWNSWYRRIWKESFKHYLVLGCFVFTGINVIFVLFFANLQTIVNNDRICAVMNSVGIIYGTVHYSICALIFFACFVMLVVIFHKTNHKKKLASSERKRQLLLQWITGISVILVSIPNLVLILNEWKIPEMNPLVVGVTYCLYALHSSFSLPTYLYFKKDFRHRFLRMFFCYRSNELNSSVARLPSSITVSGPKMTTIQIWNVADQTNC